MAFLPSTEDEAQGHSMLGKCLTWITTLSVSSGFLFTEMRQWGVGKTHVSTKHIPLLNFAMKDLLMPFTKMVP